MRITLVRPGYGDMMKGYNMMMKGADMMMKNDKKARVRVNMRIPKDLLTWAKRYAKGKNTCVTQVFVQHLQKLKKKAANPITYSAYCARASRRL